MTVDGLLVTDDAMTTGPITVVVPEAPEPEPAPVEVEPMPTGQKVDASPTEVVWNEQTLAEVENLAKALVRKDAKSRALRTLLQSGLVHVLASVVLVVYPLLHFGHMTPADWKAIGMLALSTAGHGVLALVMRLLSDPKVQ